MQKSGKNIQAMEQDTAQSHVAEMGHSLMTLLCFASVRASDLRVVLCQAQGRSKADNLELSAWTSS